MNFATRWPEAFALRQGDRAIIADELLVLFTRIGELEVLTDCEKSLSGRLMKELYKLLGVRSITTTLYHPATDRMVEQFNGSLKEMIRRN